MANLLGIDTNRVISFTLVMGAILAAVGGVLIAITIGKLNPFIGFLAGIKAFTAAVLGGIGSIPGAMLGGVLLGLAETFAAAYISSQYKDIVALSLLVLILLFRPTGLLGKPEVEKSDVEQQSENATMAAVLTAVIVTPVFGLQLIRQGARTTMESNWSLVAMAAAVVFVFQLLRPWLAKPFQKLKTGLPTPPSAPAKSNKLLVLLVLAAAVIWPFFAGRSSVDIATLVLIYVMLGLGLNIVVGFAGLLDRASSVSAVGAYTYALLYHWGGWSFWEALPFPGAMAALFGFVLGFPVPPARRLPGHRDAGFR